jgi:TonB family protein
MFDLTAESAESARRPLRERSLRSSVTAVLAHLVGVMAFIAVPVSRAIIVQPDTSTIQAFVATPDVFPPVPTARPTPAAPSLKSKLHAAVEQAAIEQAAAPRESPIEIQPEPTGPVTTEIDAGAAGGIEGGAAGGVIGGAIGGTVVPVAPPPARPPARSAPLRTSGAIKPPDLLHRVEPVYSAIAAVAHISGVVVVEATVDVDGSIESVTVLRSASPFLDKAATDALKQWRYAPLVIAGLPTRFVVTVTFNFRFPDVWRTSTASERTALRDRTQ